MLGTTIYCGIQDIFLATPLFFTPVSLPITLDMVHDTQKVTQQSQQTGFLMPSIMFNSSYQVFSCIFNSFVHFHIQ